MRALLVYPGLPESMFSHKPIIRIMAKRSLQPPLGLLTVAAMLPAEWEVKLVDVNVSPLTDEDLRWATMVFISAMIAQLDTAREIIDRCRKENRPVVAGGPLFTLQHELFGHVDHLVLGEAECTLPRFLDDLSRGKAKHLYRADEFADITCSPTPRWDLVDLRHYVSANLQFTRGCPYNCEFCDVERLFGRKPRSKSVKQIITELDALHLGGWSGPVFFVDDNFIGTREYIKKEFLPALARWQWDKMNFMFYTMISINVADDEGMLNLLHDAGFYALFIGIETPDSESLLECDKKHNRNRDIIADIRRIQSHGLQVQGGFILGFDSDTAGTFPRMAELVKKTGIISAEIGLLQAIPGTRLYERMKREGRLKDDTALGLNTNGQTNIVTNMNHDDLLRGYEEVINTIYSPNEYYGRILDMIRSNPPPGVWAPPRLSPRSLVYAVYFVIFHGIPHGAFWRFFLWTAFKSPGRLVFGILHAVMCHHYRLFFKKHVFARQPCSSRP